MKNPLPEHTLNIIIELSGGQVMNTFSIRQGSIVIYRLFDVAARIDLSMLEAGVLEGVKRLRLSKHIYMKALEFADPPVSFVMTGFSKQLFGQEINVNVIAKAYDFGVLSLALVIPVPEGTTFFELENVAKELDRDESIDHRAREYILQLFKDLGKSIDGPSIKEPFVEDYMVFLIQELEQKVGIPEFLEQYDPSRLLLYETRELSPHTIEETLRSRFSYYPEDLVIVHLDNAFVIEPSGSTDILDLLEFANAQILELRFYDDVLDNQLAWIYGELSKRKRVSVFRLRGYEKLARKIMETVTELSEVTEKVDNALKVTEDVYYARIYRTAMSRLRSMDWEQSIKDKLQIVTNIYKMIYEDISTKRGHLLEIGIILLIIIEIILLIVIEW